MDRQALHLNIFPLGWNLGLPHRGHFFPLPLGIFRPLPMSLLSLPLSITMRQNEILRLSCDANEARPHS
jgi:hypothetical protein